MTVKVNFGGLDLDWIENGINVNVLKQRLF